MLERLVFPLSDLEKTEIRALAKDKALVSADREESQEICFIPSGKYTEYIKERYPNSAEPGNFVDAEGNVLGRHSGIIRYTVGQRKGLGIALGKRMFVTKIDTDSNTVTLSEEGESALSLSVSGALFSGIEEMAPGEMRECEVKLRYLAPKVACRFEYLGDGRGRVELSSPARALTPGQSAVFYDGERVIFGAFID